MRKLFIAALLAVTVASSAFAAGSSKVNSFALKNFNTQFTHASDVSWTTSENYIKAVFLNNNERMEAYYNSTGDLIGTSRSINTEVLPTSAKRTLAKKYDGYTVKEAIQFDGTEESAYFISLENDQESVILKVAENQQVSTIKQVKK